MSKKCRSEDLRGGAGAFSIRRSVLKKGVFFKLFLPHNCNPDIVTIQMTDYKIVCNFIGPPSQVTNLKTSVDCLICKDKKCML